MQNQFTKLSGELERVAELLRVQPVKPVKTIHHFIARLGIRTTSRDYNGLKVCQFLDAHMHGAIDHTIKLTLQNVLIMVQPYHMPTQANVTWIEALGGAVLRPYEDWGFHHIICKPCVFLVPEQAVRNFELKTHPAPPRQTREVMRVATI